MHLTQALEFVNIRRKPLLFLGAGFSFNTNNIEGNHTPTSKILSKKILEELGIEEEAPLSFAVDKLRERLPPKDAYEFLRRSLTIRQLSELQNRILSFPWQRIYTTNIDNCGVLKFGERAHNAVDEFKEPKRGDFVYLHGSLAQCSTENFYSRVKMGEQIYLSGAQTKTKYHDQFETDLFECDCCVVIGYGMGDENLANIFFNSPDSINKCFVFSGETGEVESYRISLIANNTRKTASDLLTLLDSRPENLSQQFPSNVIIENNLFDRKSVTQTSRQNLLIFGRYDRNIARSSWADAESNNYTVNRTIAGRLAKTPGPHFAVVHSHFSNGKSLLKEEAIFYAAKLGRPTFTIDPASTKDRLLEAIESLPFGSIVFFEGNIFELEHIKGNIINKNICFVSFSRTTTYRSAGPSLFKSYSGYISSYDVNSLDEDEIVQFYQHINKMGFWPNDLKRGTPEKEIGILKNAFGANINSIILRIFENDKVRDLIRSEFELVRSYINSISDQFVVNVYSQIIDISIPPYFIGQFQNVDYDKSQHVKGNIVEVGSDGIVRFHNSILGEYCLQNLFDEKNVIGAVVRFANFIGNHPAESNYRWIVRRFHRYWNLKRLLGSSTKPLEVFDLSSNIPSIATDPLFWVQYSIAEMENENFFQAWQFIDFSYNKAADKRSNFDAHHLDTHWTRLAVREIRVNGWMPDSGLKIIKGLGKLLSVVQRRPEDSTFHVSSVTLELLKIDIDYASLMKQKEFLEFCKNLKRIYVSLNTLESKYGGWENKSQILDEIRQYLERYSFSV